MSERKPSILLPFVPGPVGCRDVFVYLRPETNGVELESLIMKAAREYPEIKEHVSLAYLANFPGDFIAENRLIEQHYRIKILFSIYGRELFTPYMKRAFKAYYRTSFGRSEILGPYEAMKRLGLDEEGLFNLWVKPSRMMHINGQNIKKLDSFYVLNYDIPALLHKNNINTDIAVMIFRCCDDSSLIERLVSVIEDKLKAGGLISEFSPVSRLMHYSKGPFEELLDSCGFLYDRDLVHVPLHDTSFGRFLMSRGIDSDSILGVIENPIMCFRTAVGDIVESDIYSYTKSDSYEKACGKLESAAGQYIMNHPLPEVSQFYNGGTAPGSPSAEP